jgi:hypothetical protein
MGEDADREFFTSPDGVVLLKCDKCEDTLSSLEGWAAHQLVAHQINAGAWTKSGGDKSGGTGVSGGSVKVKRLLPCPHCWKPFHTAYLRSHIAITHTNSPLFVCSVCSKGYSAKIGLDQHMMAVHGGGLPKTFLCLLCGDAFASKGA